MTSDDTKRQERHMKKYGIRLCIMFMLVLTACGKKQKAADETVYRIYEVNKEETKVASREITTTETDTEKLLGVLIEEAGCRTGKNTGRYGKQGCDHGSNPVAEQYGGG